MILTGEYDKAINLEDIINEINENFTISLKKILAPFVDRINSIDSSHRAISETLRKIPEFRDLVSENEELKNELIEFKRSYVEYPSVTLKVTEKERDNEDTNTIVDQVYSDVNLLSYKANVGALVNSDAMYNADDDSSVGDDDDSSEGDDDSNNGSEDDMPNDNIDECDRPLTARSVLSVVESNDGDNSDIINENESVNDDVENNDDINEEVYLIEIHNKGTFYTDDEINGIIYTIEDDDEIGEKVGIFNNGIEVFD